MKLPSLLAVAMIALSTAGHAITFQTVGFGNAVNIAHRNASFDGIATFDNLLGYTENGLVISVDDLAFVGFDAFNPTTTAPFHYGTGGNNSFVSISAADGESIFAIEFLLGNGYFSDTTNTVWETWKDGSVVSSGLFSVVRGTTVGWQDAAGFDELRVISTFGSNMGDFQAIALDNVRVQLTNGLPDPVPEGGFTLSLFGLSLTGLAFLRRKLG